MPARRQCPCRSTDSGFVVERAITAAPRAKLAVVAPAHHFPLATVLGLQRRLELLRWAERHSGWIAEDDYDGEYRFAGRPLAPLRALDRSGRVAYLGSFSKLLFPPLRLSYVVLPEALMPAARNRMAEIHARPSPLGQGRLPVSSPTAIWPPTSGARGCSTRRAAKRWSPGSSAISRIGWRAFPIAPAPTWLHGRFPRLRLASTIAVVAAAAQVGIAVAPLSACYAGRRRQQGLILGYAGTPEVEIASACATLSRVLRTA